MSQWITPEEMERRREMKKKLVTFSLPVIAIIFAAIITVLANSM
ncbi:hypothetical protein ACFFIX_12710 [Metabacillus herbersteinensis]|uniref:Uncharacterized protein n=1 Tax=Metabacillus herbersteinensis TaxID=283816 RepID=A0ABV6GF34_9BACI